MSGTWVRMATIAYSATSLWVRCLLAWAGESGACRWMLVAGVAVELSLNVPSRLHEIAQRRLELTVAYLTDTDDPPRRVASHDADLPFFHVTFYAQRAGVQATNKWGGKIDLIDRADDTLFRPTQIRVCLPVRHMTRGGVDEGRYKPQDTDDDAADGHPNVEPAIYWESAHHSGCSYRSAPVLHARILLFILG